MPVSLTFTKDNSQKFRELLAARPETKWVAEALSSNLRYGDSVSVGIDEHVREPGFLESVYDIAQTEGDRSIMGQVTGFMSMRDSPNTHRLSKKLQDLEVGIISYMMKNFIDGWLYEKTAAGKMLPWLVTHIEFHPKQSRDDRDSVSMMMRACSAAVASRSSDVTSTSRSFDYEDIQGKTIPEILAEVRLFHETPRLRAGYDADLAAFFEYRPMDGCQFLASGAMGNLDDYWWRREDKARRISESQPIRVVNDESSIDRVHTGTRAGDSRMWELQGVERTVTLPYHPYILCFALDNHSNYWVHASDMKPYEYDPTIRDKLILPQEHRDLIDLLTTDEGGVSDLIIGKGLGTTILCLGPPGTGKTLTAEVYSETVKKPLYSVHSGQLGINGSDVERNLKSVFSRAARWGAILLIDEADVYIRERDNDTEHNAIVASFLRTMEYYRGLMFMTSNRTDDVDDAIKSRAAAIIKYEVPRDDVAMKMWSTHVEAVGLSLKGAGISPPSLVEAFPNATGRDIRNILALAARIVRGGASKPLSMDLLRQCAMFKGVI